MAEYPYSPNPTNSAPFLLKQIADQKVDPKTFSSHQRRICIRFLLQEQKHTQAEIATILNVNFRIVSKDKKIIQEQNSWMIDDLDERKVATEIITTAEVASARAFRQGRNKDAWEIQRQCIEVLQSLGYLKRTPVEFKGAISIQEILKLAIDPKDENALLGNSGQGSTHSLTNGAS